MIEITDLDLQTLLWGHNPKKETYLEAFLAANNPTELRDALDNILHDELRRVLDTLEEQMRRDEPVARYNADNNPKASEPYNVAAIRVLMGESANIDPREAFLFTDPSIFGGFYSAFVRAVAAAHPPYHLSADVSLGTVELLKNGQTPV